MSLDVAEGSGSAWADQDGDPRIVAGSTVIVGRPRASTSRTFGWHPRMDRLVGTRQAVLDSELGVPPGGIDAQDIASCRSWAWTTRDCVFVTREMDEALRRMLEVERKNNGLWRSVQWMTEPLWGGCFSSVVEEQAFVEWLFRAGITTSRDDGCVQIDLKRLEMVCGEPVAEQQEEAKMETEYDKQVRFVRWLWEHQEEPFEGTWLCDVVPMLARTLGLSEHEVKQWDYRLAPTDRCLVWVRDDGVLCVNASDVARAAEKLGIELEDAPRVEVPAQHTALDCLFTASRWAGPRPHDVLQAILRCYLVAARTASPEVRRVIEENLGEASGVRTSRAREWHYCNDVLQQTQIAIGRYATQPSMVFVEQLDSFYDEPMGGDGSGAAAALRGGRGMDQQAAVDLGEVRRDTDAGRGVAMPYRDDLEAAHARLRVAEQRAERLEQRNKQLVQEARFTVGTPVVVLCLGVAIVGVLGMGWLSCHNQSPPEPVERQHPVVQRFGIGDVVSGDVQLASRPMLYHELCSERPITVRAHVRTGEEGIVRLWAGVRGQQGMLHVRQISRRYSRHQPYGLASPLPLPPGCIRFAVVRTDMPSCGGCSCDMPSHAYTLRVERVGR